MERRVEIGVGAIIERGFFFTASVKSCLISDQIKLNYQKKEGWLGRIKVHKGVLFAPTIGYQLNWKDQVTLLTT